MLSPKSQAFKDREQSSPRRSRPTVTSEISATPRTLFSFENSDLQTTAESNATNSNHDGRADELAKRDQMFSDLEKRFRGYKLITHQAMTRMDRHRRIRGTPKPLPLEHPDGESVVEEIRWLRQWDHLQASGDASGFDDSSGWRRSLAQSSSKVAELRTMMVDEEKRHLDQCRDLEGQIALGKRKLADMQSQMRGLANRHAADRREAELNIGKLRGVRTLAEDFRRNGVRDDSPSPPAPSMGC